MRSDNTRWPAPHAEGLLWQADGLALRPLRLSRQTLISGVDVLRSHAPATGWPEPATGATYTLALRRDRVLLVGGPDRDDGWDAKRGEAVTDMTDGFATYELSGPHLPDLLLRGAEMQPSRSAIRLWAGLEVILYHHENVNTARLHIARAHSESLVETVIRRAEAMLRQV